MPKRPHPGAEVGDELAQWVEEMTDDLADALLASPEAPETARMTEAEKMRLFSHRIWTPDGQPNQQGRDALVAKYGWQGMAAILRDVDKRRRRLTADVEALPEPEGA